MLFAIVVITLVVLAVGPAIIFTIEEWGGEDL